MISKSLEIEYVDKKMYETQLDVQELQFVYSYTKKLDPKT